MPAIIEVHVIPPDRQRGNSFTVVQLCSQLWAKPYPLIRCHDLNAWIGRTRREGSPALRPCSAGLVRNLDAVTAGPALPHGSGAVEGMQ